MRSSRKNAVMNLPDPSGSSPPEKPPGKNRISDAASLLANRSADSATPWAVRLLITKTSGTAPAFSSARAVSYSQLVPGNTGISARGAAALAGGRTRAFAVWA